MKFQHAVLRWTIPVVAVALSGLALVSWAGSPKHLHNAHQQKEDTVPKRNRISRDAKDRDLDKELRQLEEAQKALQNVPDIDFEKIQKEINEAVEKINLEQIELQTQKALQQVDL